MIQSSQTNYLLYIMYCYANFTIVKMENTHSHLLTSQDLEEKTYEN